MHVGEKKDGLGKKFYNQPCLDAKICWEGAHPHTYFCTNSWVLHPLSPPPIVSTNRKVNHHLFQLIPRIGIKSFHTLSSHNILSYSDSSGYPHGCLSTSSPGNGWYPIMLCSFLVVIHLFIYKNFIQKWIRFFFNWCKVWVNNKTNKIK